MHPRLTRLRRQVHAPALLIRHPLSIGYLLEHPPIHGWLLVTRGSCRLFTHVPFLPAANRLARRGISLHPTADLPVHLRSLKRVTVEKDNLYYIDFMYLKTKMKNTTMILKSGMVTELRRVKDPAELATIRRADRMTAGLMRRARQVLRPGITEAWLARQLHRWALEAGADGLAFDPIVGFGPHTAHPHHVPGGRRLKANDHVQLDLGVRLNGYCSDRSEILFMGRPKPEVRRAYRAVKRAAAAVIAHARTGARIRSLDRLARQVLRDQGVPDDFPHALGHGVGLEVHEAPTLSARGVNRALKRGEVLAIEPAVYRAGEYGVRWERLVIVP